MTRNEFENYLGKKVKIILFDNDTITGVLRKTGEKAFENEPNLFLPKNLYFVTKTMESTVCESYLFKVSHVKKIECL